MILNIKTFFALFTFIFLLTLINYCIGCILIPGPLHEAKTLIIGQKLSVTQISARLKNHQIINHQTPFWFFARLYSLKSSLKSGEYIFTPQISGAQILKILSEGKSIVHKLMIPEGVMVSEIIDKINSEERLLGEIKGKIPEGFLMPSTYFFSYGDQKEQIIDRMRKSMSAALDIVMTKLPTQSPLETRLEVLTLASIIEKEAQLDEEKPIIAAVFLNRLKKGIKLQADPTSIYAITEGKFKLGRPLTKKDLLTQSPYNTYYIKNLPPGPIACPGLKSLEAVVNPAKTNAIYFVVNGRGGHNFSDNLVEHNKNIANYKKGLSPIP